MNSCPACAKAELCPTTGLMQAGCMGCEARGLARSPSFYEAAKAEAMTPQYRGALWALFGEKWQEGHELVKAWAAKLEAAK